MSSISHRSNRRRSRFNLSHSYKTSADLGNLFPCLAKVVSPGDTFKLASDAVVRFGPMLAPLMHEVDVYTHYFFVPNRLIWDNWESFITGGERGDDTSVSPTITADGTTGWPIGSVADFISLPTDVPNVTSCALPFRAYTLILNEWYRQQDLQDPLALSKEDGDDQITDTTLYNRNWNKDYFTSCAPSQQKGPAVLLPLTGNAPVIGRAPVSGIGIDTDAPYYGATPFTPSFESAAVDGVSPYTPYNKRVYGLNSNNATLQTWFKVTDDSTGTTNYTSDVFAEGEDARSTMQADLSGVTSATINDLRQSFQLQRWLEANMRGGSRYIESILNHFGVHSADARLQRPEFLGGGRSPIVFSEVLQTSATDGTSPQANLAGHGFGAHRSNQFVKSFSEHGYVIGLLSVMPKSGYVSQGIPRDYSRTTRFDYLWPLFAHLGEQGVLNKEIYSDPSDGLDDEVFGYQPRYQEYRKQLNIVTGQFRTTLNFWHLARIFAERPNLNDVFINCNPSKRIFAVTDQEEQSLYIHVYHRLKAVRVLPKYGTPGYVDH